MKWYELYGKFSESLNLFYQKYGKDSGKVLYKNYYEYINNTDYSINLDWLDKFNSFNVHSLDPMHVFASFNYWDISLKKRKERIKLFIDLIKFSGISIDNLFFDLENAELDVFEYFPHINITHSVAARQPDIQEEIWEFFDLVYRYNSLNSKESQRFKDIFNNIESKGENKWYGIRYPSATIFMFWVNSNDFIPLDKNTLALLKSESKGTIEVNSFETYSKLIQYKRNNIFRNLTRMAIDETFNLTLNNEEQLAIANYFYLKSSESYTNQNINLNIEYIDGYEFDLYYMLDHSVYMISYRKNGISSVSIINKWPYNHPLSFPRFQILAIRCLSETFTKKVIKKGKLYYFNNNFIIDKNNISISPDATFPYQLKSIKNINISAIVGKNGTGKSTIVELLVMAINNLTHDIQTSGSKSMLHLENLFYTIYTNYSIHSLNEKNYHGTWLQKLFHKNDSYQTPVVIEPYRDKGNIDINRLEELTTNRLIARIIDPINYTDEAKYTELIKGIEATHLKISLQIEKVEKILQNFNSTDISSVINQENHKCILSYLNIENTTNHYDDIVKLYICNKIKSIATTYTQYNQYIEDYQNEDYLKELINDKSHVTFKLKQAINFLKYDLKYKYDSELNDIKTLAFDLSFLIAKYDSLSVIELIPPSIFDTEIILNNDENHTFRELSSGQKQQIYTLSSITYHLQNIDSRHRSSDSLLKYENVNIILDEIELYFHPDMQRTFINDLLEVIEHTGYLENILSLNIILVTHSPFILSDIPKSNIMYLHEDKDFKGEDDIGETFGANIHTLLDNSFFMENGLMGKFAKKSIQELIDSISKGDDNSKNEILKKINIIGEPILRNKLLEMYYEAFPNRLEQLIKEQERIADEIKSLKKRTHND